MTRNLSEYAKRKKLQYDTKYMKSRVLQKTIGFNRGNEEDMKLYNWVNRQQNQTQYIKGLIREDMDGSGE